MAKNFHKTTTDYTGRTVDMLLLQFIPAPVSEAEVNPDVSKSPRIATGIEKLVQRYALLFLTQLGTVKNSESTGTEFLSLLGTGHIYDDNTLKSAANSANRLVITQIRSEDRSLDTPDDEALDTADVVNTEIDRRTATVTVTVAITSEAGERYVYTMPLKSGV